ncbi:MAG: hypothetical protein WA888_11375 [Burkholderiaceae bacterium]
MSLSEKILELLVERATLSRDQAASQASGSERELQSARLTHQSLLDFAEQKAQERRSQINQSIGTQDVISHTRFSKKLVHATELQGELTERLDKTNQSNVQALQARQRQLLAIELLANRRKEQLQEQQRRAEQRISDENAALGYTRKPGHNNTQGS